MEVGPPVPQCQPGWQEKPRLPHSPGLSVRPRFVWFRGSAPSTPTHPLACRLPHGSRRNLLVTGGKAKGEISPFSAVFPCLVAPFLIGGGGNDWE